MIVFQETPFVSEGPQPLLREIEQGAAYPVEALGPLRAVVEAVQGQTLAPIAIAAQSALSVTALAVQAFADVETLGGTRPVSLYALTIAKSGERKSSCDEPLMAPLRAFERRQAASQQTDTQQWENAHALWKGDRDRILLEAKKNKGAGKTAAQADLDALGAEPKAPPITDRTVTEPTFEGLTRLFAHGMPSLGIFSDEGGQFLGGHAMSSENRQKTLAALNGTWGGQPIKRTRQGDGSYALFGRRLSVHLMVQPGVARTFLSDPQAADTGFVPRFLMTEPPSTMGTRLQSVTRQDPQALGAYADRMDAILETDMPLDATTGGLQPRVLSLSPQARTLLVQFSDALELEMGKSGKLSGLTGTASKAAEQAARIAGVLTLWGDLHAPHVELDAMANGITLAQFYLSEALRLSEAALVSAETEKAESLRKWLLENWPAQAQRYGRSPDKITLRDIVRLGPNALRESKIAQASVNLLATHGWLVVLEQGTEVDGRARSKAFQIVRPSDDI